MIIIHMIVTLLGWKLYTGWGFISREGSSERSSLFRYTKSEWCWIPFDVVEFWIGFQYSNMFVDFQYMNMFVDDFDFMILMMNDVIITSCHWWWCLACPNQLKQTNKQLKQTNKQTDKQWSTVFLTYLLTYLGRDNLGDHFSCLFWTVFKKKGLNLCTKQILLQNWYKLVKIGGYMAA